MADKPRSRFGRRPEFTVSAVAIGAVTAGFSIAPAMAAPDYPSWDDVQDAKRDEAAAQAEVANINGLLDSLEATAAAATREQQIAAERYLMAQADLDAVVAAEEELRESAKEAAQKASVSRMRAGLLAAHLSRQGGGDVGLTLGLSGDSDAMLYQLSAMGKLTQQSAGIYAEASADRNLAESLRTQAELAAEERRVLAVEAEEVLAEAEAAASAAEAAVSEQETRQNELLGQLALLKGTTAAAEAAYRAEVAAREAAAQPSARPPAATPPRAPSTGTTPPSAPQNPAPANPAPANPAPANPAPSNPAPADPAPAPSNPAPAPSNPAPAPANPAPDKVATAIAFARAQIGDRYKLTGAGPDEWDCSGLTKAAYAAAGINIGTHSATNQYYTAQARGQLVPYSQRQPGDLIFWTDGSSMYHVAIYTGGGMMVEAPNPSALVRERGIWGSGDVVGYVARPTA